jgi:XTP/dITP diphosphohydrolase
MKSIIVATKNKHKFSEIQAFFGGSPDLTSNVSFYSLLNLPAEALTKTGPKLPEIDEDCLSFVGNALKKAKVISEATGLPVLADDSGLSVQALDGRPGVFSARYAGKGAADDQNNQKLLQELKSIPLNQREAKFICAIVLYLPDGTFYTAEGELTGSMVDEYQGKHGFGYDPIFYMPDRKCTLAQVPEEEKILFSHRTKALENLLKITNHFKQLAYR